MVNFFRCALLIIISVICYCIITICVIKAFTMYHDDDDDDDTNYCSVYVFYSPNASNCFMS